MRGDTVFSNKELRSFWPAIWVGGLVAGTVDVGLACVIYKTTPLIILQAIAGGVLGRSAFERGWSSAALGLALQWGMSLLIASCCVFASNQIAFLARRWVTAGCLYGVITFIVMDYIVVPLSASRTQPHFSAPWFVKNMIAMLLFGLIISSVAHRYARKAPPGLDS
jgi:hypothetical protein